MPAPLCNNPGKMRPDDGRPSSGRIFLQRLSRAGALLAACLLGPGTAAASERIVATADGQAIGREVLLQRLAGHDLILLGELHDNPHHHAARAWLLEKLAATRPAIVAEHLEHGRQASGNGPLLADLESAGFDAGNWRWPVHQALFEAARRTGGTLHGGNIPRQLARDIVKRGADALPADVAAAIADAPLDANARQTLERDLLDSHCGQLPATLIPGLSLAQRARDAAMSLAIGTALNSGHPVILLAGNGHVRRDYGIPVLLERQQPGRRRVAIGFLESDTANAAQAAALASRFDYLWITEPAERRDPCLDFPKPQTAPAA
ncbi:putative iron-regulated protein [Azonexus fungiphilus]|uniref:Putative iron-regulated protein n=1 Tax=Azonexus fungiphilus TaxID=146940 RepID=A0A495WC25_9RHOO|nr:ChaN family lipoprotein [Azonexus fungiphilus]RKT59242.1 putative iron-regulated protein [Azonexus fungiphilus]